VNAEPNPEVESKGPAIRLGFVLRAFISYPPIIY
jgi:hypothetical protein